MRLRIAVLLAVCFTSLCVPGALAQSNTWAVPATPSQAQIDFYGKMFGNLLRSHRNQLFRRNADGSLHTNLPYDAYIPPGAPFASHHFTRLRPTPANAVGCLMLRTYIFEREDGGENMKLVGQRTCTPAARFQEHNALFTAPAASDR